MWVRSLGQEDPLEQEMATHSSIFAWRIPWPAEPDRLRSMGSQRAGLSTHMQYVSMCDIKRWVLGALLSRGRTLSDGKAYDSKRRAQQFPCTAHGPLSTGIMCPACLQPKGMSLFQVLTSSWHTHFVDSLTARLTGFPSCAYSRKLYCVAIGTKTHIGLCSSPHGSDLQLFVLLCCSKQSEIWFTYIRK